MEIHQITTPALLVDLDAMEFNLQRMAEFFADKHAKLRPHFKNHKVPLFAWKQLRAGAIGITCATMREAEILVHHGIGSILIANEIPTIDRLLTQLDRKTQEVEIEARVVAATRQFARDIGTQLGFGWGNGHSAIGGNQAVGVVADNGRRTYSRLHHRAREPRGAAQRDPRFRCSQTWDRPRLRAV